VRASPSDQPTTEDAGYTPHKSDWKVNTKITGKECFGEAGCNVEVTVDPKFVGTTPPSDSGTLDVTYELTGTEDPLIDTFTVTGGQISYTKTQNVQTKSSGSKMGAKITDVDYSE
jgi:hypothetical protein